MSHKEEFTVDQELRIQALHHAVSVADLWKFGPVAKEIDYPNDDKVISVADKFYNFLKGEVNSETRSEKGSGEKIPGPSIVASPVGIGPADNSSER